MIGPESLDRQLYLGADACLALEDGRVFFGHAFGSRSEAEAEVVFNTSMAGYQEIATDPSYHGQMVVLTHPQVGNYGVQAEATESRRPWIAALIVRDLAAAPNHWLASGDLTRYLAEAGVPGIQGVDTRALTRHLRINGTLRAVLGRLDPGAPVSDQVDRLRERARRVISLSEKNLVAEACAPESVAATTMRPLAVETVGSRLRIALIDCGVKHNIVRSLAARGAEVVALPWEATISEVIDSGADGVVLSNGPGDPERMDTAVALARKLTQRAIPTLGICLGHQVFGRAAGGTTSRLGYGHHGGNHPVRELDSGHVHITSQNHEFQVDAASIPPESGFFVSMVNLNDGSVEGLAHRELPIFTVQYHPEGCPGPQDNQYVFERFLAMVEKPVSGAQALRELGDGGQGLGKGDRRAP
jgi:carbamoyl-phosphate synthase small subunit